MRVCECYAMYGKEQLAVSGQWKNIIDEVGKITLLWEELLSDKAQIKLYKVEHIEEN
jgi:hypothetical protein